MDIAEIARRLNVAHVLEGSVRKSGDKLRITAQLIRAADSSHLWSETYDRPLDDIFAVQDEIAAAVVAQLKLKLLGAAPKAKATDPKAYALFLQARQLRSPRHARGVRASRSRCTSRRSRSTPTTRRRGRAWPTTTSSRPVNGLRPIDEGYRWPARRWRRRSRSTPTTHPPTRALGWIAMTTTATSRPPRAL